MFAAAPDDWSGVSWWLGAILFSLQIFGDFVGYSSISIGLAAWMGYHFHENFLNRAVRPVRATTRADGMCRLTHGCATTSIIRLATAQ